MPGDDAFHVPTTPIAPGGGRGPRFVVAVLAALLLGGFLIARWSPGPSVPPRLETSAPTLALPVPSTEPVAVASPLPRRQWYSAPAAPLDDLVLEADGIRRLRLASARLAEPVLGQPGRDLLLPVASGEVVCLCWQPSGREAGDPRQLDLVRYDRSGEEVSRSRVARVNGLDLSDPDSGPTTVALEPTPDGRSAVLARAVRAPTRWQVRLELIDLPAASVVDRIELVDDPRGDGTHLTHVEPPTVRIAPDGRHLVITTAASRERPIGPDRVDARAWIVGLGKDRFGQVTGAPTLPDPTAACDWLDFVRSDLIAEGCRLPVDAPDAHHELRRFDLEGRPSGAFPVVPWRAESGYPLIDVGRGIVYGWDPWAHTLSAVDVAAGVEHLAEAPADERAPPANVQVVRERPEPGPTTTWSVGRASTVAGSDRSLIGSPDGRLLFAIGEGGVFGSTSGVWVFDAATLELLERWPALASYASLSLLEDGRWLAAIGRPSVTPTGGPADWSASLTIHDVLSGRPVLRLGDLGSGGPLAFAWSEPPVAVR